MTNLTAAPGWDAVPQIEVTTPLKGGPGGPLNAPLQALADRTEWLRTRVVHGTDPEFGAKYDGSDDTAAVAAMFNSLQNGDVLDLDGKAYALFVGNTGAADGDAISLSSVPRLYGKSNIIIQNGTLYAANPAASDTKLRFPSTFSVDGCTDIRFLGVTFIAKGESYGDADASQSLGSEPRRAWLAQNGGHACVVIRSNKIYFDSSCRFERAGSCAAFYASSSDNVVVDSGYASAESLGYAAFAADSWCGDSSVSGFVKHRLYLNNCRSGNNGTAYGSKGCVSIEDRDVYAYVNGGVFKDAYANGSAHQLGSAFSANSAHMYVTGAEVENCAAIGMMTNSTADETVLEVTGVRARGLRTAVHIFDATSFGTHKAKYVACTADINGSALWSEAELSRASVVANRKQSSTATIDIIGCTTTGAHTFAINASACYGGLRVVGGHHTVTDRIIDSAGWGGSGAGTLRGYEFLSGANLDVMLSNPASPSTALTQGTTAINAIKNQDASSVFTYQYIDCSRSVNVRSNAMRDFVALVTAGSGLGERANFAQSLFGCYQTVNPGEARTAGVKVVSYDGIAGSFAKVTLAFTDGKRGTFMTLLDDTLAVRRDQGAYAGPTIVGNELRYGVYLNSTAQNLTVGSIYPAQFSA